MAPIVKPVADAYAFSYLQSETNETHTVDVDICRDEDKEHWEQFATSRLLNYYVGPFATPHVKCYLKKIKIFYLTFVDNVLDGAFVEVTVVNKSEDESTEHTTPLFLRCPVAAVLIVLRAHTQEPDGSVRPREYVVMAQENRRNVSQGYRDVPEIPYGRFDQDRHVRGPLVTPVEELCDIQLVDQDFTKLNGRKGVSSMPGCSLDNVELYLYRKTVPEDVIANLRKQVEKAGEKAGSVSVKLIPLGMAWQVTNDLKTLGAIFYFHELRYHNRMPRYYPPSGGRRTTSNKPTPPLPPAWTSVAELNPNSQSFNLVAKVHEPLTVSNEQNKNQRRRGQLVIGDSTGVVTLVVTERQLEVAGLDTKGTTVVLRNAAIDMSSGRIRLYVSQQWGDIVTDMATQEGLPSLEFEVEDTNDMSKTQYELVTPEGESSGSHRSTTNRMERPTGGRFRRNGFAPSRSVRAHMGLRRPYRGRGGSALNRSAGRPVAAINA
eukprot:Gregarina_sp_Pseudo_9__1577@NODE_205_length_3618_cov_206_722269_g190_i0_p1_GENE_NODE_205_length_3618_cov_206_722269_g190_i0NODE_205_length_3618_cov_206_722269_g190_i0_p1_ORF_typecomplete_len538_score100_52DUF5323/PF17257_2/0_38_NODE_205_length_3618_cov_206_722269_g190_i020053474